MEEIMGKATAEEIVVIPKKEYRFLKELYKTVKRQDFLLRIAEAEDNLEKGKVKKSSVNLP